MDARRFIADKVREAREYLGFTQQEVADHLGLHRPSVSEIESGGRQVSAEELVKLAKLLSRPIAYFIGEQAPDPSETLAAMTATLADDDRAELLKFAEFLYWRKKVKP